MRIKITPCLATVLLATTTAMAQFEGVLEMKMKMADTDGVQRGSGTMTMSMSKAGIRNEMNVDMGQMKMKTVTLQKSDLPDVTYRINESSKTYSEMPVTKTAEQTTWTVDKLGEEKVLEYTTQHILAKPKSGNGQPMEMWVAKDLAGTFENYGKMLGRNTGNDAGLAKALKEAGAEGMPLKIVVSTPEGKATTEVVKVEKKSLPASTFEIPAGYTKSSNPMDTMGVMSGPQADAMKAQMEEAKKKMEEQMKNMPPEQREMMERMMKQRPGGQ